MSAQVNNGYFEQELLAAEQQELVEEQQQQLVEEQQQQLVEEQQQQLVEKQQNVLLNELPDEILEFILTYLPPYKDLENCSLVCKRWHNIVQDLIRRSKNNLQKGLLDFRLCWEVFTQETANSIAANKLAHAQHSKVETRQLHIHKHNNLHNARSMQQQQQQQPPIIAGRFSHSAVRYANYMYVFGGGSSSDTTFNDLWRFDLSAMCWERPHSKGAYPSPKGSASMVVWRDQLVLFGGWRYPSLHPPYQPWCLFDELHFYDLQKQDWKKCAVCLPAPPPIAGHSASVHGDCMIVFGGYQISYGLNSNSNETWCFDLISCRWWQPRFAPNSVKPPARYGQYQLELDAEHLLIVGGCGGPNSIYSDAWLLDMSHDLWCWRAIPVRNKKFAASHMWCNPACKVEQKLVVLGPTPNMPQDFQLMKQMRMPVGGALPGPRNPHLPGVGGVAVNNVAAVREMRRIPGNQQQQEQQQQQQQDLYFANRRAILMQHQRNANNNLFAINNNNNNNGQHNNANGLNGNNNHASNNNNNQLQPRTGRLRDIHAVAAAAVATTSNAAALVVAAASIEERSNQNRPTTSNAAAAAAASPHGNGSRAQFVMRERAVNGAILNEIEAANRLQRNLALRCRDHEPILPKRFDDFDEDPIRMVAFTVRRHTRNNPKDNNERIRRMEEKMEALRNSRYAGILDLAKLNNLEQKQTSHLKEPSPKRVKRNVLSLFVCDLSAVLHAEDPHIQWVEHKNYGVIAGAPERLILSTMVPGNGELILFGGVHKETLGELAHEVSNTLHFLSAPRDIV